MAGDESKWIGRQLADGRYQIISKLGAGGMAVVFKARDHHLDCDVVVKVPHTSTMEAEVYAGRFSREIKLLVGLIHPHIVPITDHGDFEGHPYAVMKYLAGGSLREKGKTDDRQHEPAWQIRHLRSWLPNIADALDFIHDRNYIHRDVKPENILFDDNGHVFLTDFGIAKVLAANPSQNKPTVLPTQQFGVMLGTPQYSPPEVMQEMPCTPAADQYGLAMILYEYFTRRHPYGRLSAVEIYRRMMSLELAPVNEQAPWVSTAVAEQIHRGLSRDPKRRFVNCKAFAAAVISLMEQTMPNVLATESSNDAPEYKEMTCPSCRTRLRVAVAQKHKRVRCTNCSSLLYVPVDMAVLQIASDYVVSGNPVPASIPRPPSNPSIDIDTPGGQSAVPTPFSPPTPPASPKKRGAPMILFRGKYRRIALVAIGGVALLLLFVFVIMPLFSSLITKDDVIVGQITIVHTENTFRYNLGVALPREQHVRYFGKIVRNGNQWNVGIANSHTRFQNLDVLEHPKDNEKKKHFAMLDGVVVHYGEYFLFPQLKREDALGKWSPFDGHIKRSRHIDLDGQVVENEKVQELGGADRHLLEFRKLYFPRDNKLGLSDAFFHGKVTFDNSKKAWRVKELFFITKNGVEKVEGKIAPFESTTFAHGRNDAAGNPTVIGTTICNVNLSFTPAKWDSVKGVPFIDERANVGRSSKSYLKGTLEWREMAIWNPAAGANQNVNLTHTEIAFHINAERCTKEQIHHTTGLLMFLTGPMVDSTTIQVLGPLAKAD